MIELSWEVHQRPGFVCLLCPSGLGYLAAYLSLLLLSRTYVIVCYLANTDQSCFIVSSVLRRRGFDACNLSCHDLNLVLRFQAMVRYGV
jgi:hypothetical protein